MLFRRASVVVLVLSLMAFDAEVVVAQQTTAGSRFIRGGSRFTSGARVGFGFNINGGTLPGDDSGRSAVAGFRGSNNHLQFRQGGAGGARGGAGGGFALRGGGGSAFFRLGAGQRSGRSVGSTSTSVTVLDGHTGFFSAGIIRPWVTGVIPIVGGQPSVEQVVGRLPGRPSSASPVYERYARLQTEKSHPRRPSVAQGSPGRQSRALQSDDRHAKRLDEAAASSAGQASEGLAEIRARKAAEASAVRQRVAANYEKGCQAQRDGKLALARNFYRLAAREASGPIRAQIADRLAEIAKQPRK